MYYKLATAFFVIFALTVPSAAQVHRYYDLFGAYDSGIYGIADKHFQGVLFPEVYKTLPSVKINYPGLWNSDMNSVGAGMLPDRLMIMDYRMIEHYWRGLYGWADVNNPSGVVGVWLGNFGIGNSYRVHEQFDMVFSWEVRDFTFRGALWASPIGDGAVKGVSIAADIDRIYAYNGNDNGGLTDVLQAYININALIKLNEKYLLKTGLSTCNRHMDESEAHRIHNRKLFKDRLTVGVVDEKLRTLEAWIGNIFSMNYGDEKSDTVSLGLSYSQGWAHSYLKHTLFFGVKAGTSALFPSKISEDAGSFQYAHYLQNMTIDGRIFRVDLAAPITLDIDLIKGIRAALSVTPRVSYMHTAPVWDTGHLPYLPEELALYNTPQHSFTTRITTPDAALSLRGSVGDKFDWMAVPSIENSVFMAAMEVKYKF